MKDNTKRFSDRVDNYSKYRPSYPHELTDHLCDAFGVSRWSIVTDVGSGTSIFSELLADKVQTLYALEPNDEMQKCAESRLKEGLGHQREAEAFMLGWMLPPLMATHGSIVQLQSADFAQ